MGVDLQGEPSLDRLEVVESVRPRLADVAAGQDVDALINSAIDDLGRVTVTTYVSILVERKVRDQLHPHPPV
jgi:hypothetical protein